MPEKNIWDLMTEAMESRYRKPGKESRIAQNPEPYLQGAKIRLDNTGLGNYGYYRPSVEDELAINKTLVSNKASLDNTIAHEAQHRQYDLTMKDKNPRLTKKQYEMLLEGYQFDPKTGKKQEFRETYTPFQVGYGMKEGPYATKNKFKDDPVVSSSDFTRGMDGLLANMVGLEGMLPPDEKLEDNPIFKDLFRTKERQKYYYNTSLPMVNSLREGAEFGRLDKQKTKRESNVSQSRESLYNKILEAMGF